MAVKHDIENNPMSLKDKLAIELQQDMRGGRVMYGGQIFNAKVKNQEEFYSVSGANIY